MKRPLFPVAATAFACAAITLTSSIVSAQTVIYSDDFETDTSANYTVRAIDNGGLGDYNVFFATNYAVNTYPRFGVNTLIPTAPSGAGGRGVKMFVNKNDATAAVAAINIYPNISQPFSNDYAMKVDMFLGYNGPAAGGSGSTEFALFGINHTGIETNWNAPSASTSDGAWFAVTGEGGAASDYRSFVGDSVGVEQRFTGVSGGFIDRDDSGSVDDEVFYGTGGEDPTLFPALWQMFPTNTVGETPGVPGKQWVKVEVRQRTNSLGEFTTTWLMNNYIIARHTNVSLVVGVTNAGTVMLGNMDNFASIANPAVDNYVIFDNLKVVDLQGVADLPEVSIATTTDTAQEPAVGEGTFTLTRSGSTAGPLTVTYVVRGSAINGTDYTNKLGGALSGTITFKPGDASTNLTIIAKDDGAGESTETVVISLNTTSSYEVFDSWAKVSILDDGDLPTVSLSTFRIGSYEGNTNSFGLFRVIFSNPTIGDVTVNYTVSGSATPGVHYTALSGSTTILAGSTTNELVIIPIQDSDTVSNRTVTITLTTGSGYNLGTVITGTNTIFNDDLPAGTGTLYSEDFDTDHTANWNAFPSAAVCDANFFFDYSTMGIPSAPHSTGGSTIGLRMRANSLALGTAAFSGISCSPKSQNFTGDYRMRYDMWINAPGPFPAGGSGSTQLGTAGVTSGTRPQWPGGALSPRDSVYFAITGEGGSTVDVRVYTNGSATLPNTAAGVYTAGTAASVITTEDPYYAVMGRITPPAAQLFSYPSQTGFTAPGAPGMVWHDVVITKKGSTLIWSIDGLRMATVNADRFGYTLSTNIFVGQSDINAGATSITLEALNFGLADNILVESLAVPTVTITNIVKVGANVQIDFQSAADDEAAFFQLYSAAVVNGTYTNISGTITQLAPGGFRAVTPYSATGERYYRILR